MLSNTAKYAIRAVIYVAMNGKEGEKLGIKKISADLKIPSPFLGKIMQSLAKHKLLNSTKGPHGGFGLGKKPENISLMDIVEVVDGVDSFNECIVGLESCTVEEKHCPIHSRYAEIRSELKTYFEGQSIATLVKDIKDSNEGITI
jgi:Rrf2 family transcriptional regulator, iron-sulfur cluster assembly transcription factor